MNEPQPDWVSYKQEILDRVDFAAIYADLKNQKPSGDGYRLACCPFHEDTNPSFGFSTKTGQWACFSGCGKGSVFDYLMMISGKQFKDVLLDLGDQCGVTRPQQDNSKPPIDTDTVRRWHERLMTEDVIRIELAKARGISDETMNKYQLGWDARRKRYTIPIKDQTGTVVNVRLYSLDSQPKMKNYTSGKHRYGSPPRLYGIDELGQSDNKQIIICEGEWDRLLLQQIGFAAVTGTHGVGTFRQEWLPAFKDLDVVIMFDCDDTGKAAARELAVSLSKAETASVKTVILPLSGLPDDKDVSDFLMKHFKSAEDIQALIDKTETEGSAGTTPSIVVNDRQMAGLVRESWDALLLANDPPQIFVRSGQMVRLITQLDVPTIESLTDASTRLHLYRAADWYAVYGKATKDSKPPHELARDILAKPHPDIPQIDGVVTTPVFAADGGLVHQPGYDPVTRLWYHPVAGFDLPTVTMIPSAADIERARAWILDDLLVDFPFAQRSDLAHAVAGLLLPFARRMIDGCTPIHLMEAPAPGSGKSLLAELIWIVTLGRACEPTTITRNEEESRKKITAILQRGLPVVVVDNVTDGLKSGQLAAALTADIWSDRILGQNTMVEFPNRATWLVTANNPALSCELARRCVRVRIDSGKEVPWLRTGFKHPAIRTWARDNRGDLVWACLTLIQAWVAKGKPPGSQTLGSFEQWSEVMGGILETADIPGFLEDAIAFYESADTEGAEWRAFVSAWWEAHGKRQITATELLQLAESHDLIGFATEGKSLRAQKTKLGICLGRQRDRRFGDFKVAAEMDGHTKTKVYRLVAAQDDLFPVREESS